jgi:hypothetical protein
MVTFIFSLSCHRQSNFADSKETHPYQAELACERASGNILKAHLIDIRNGERRILTTFGGGHMATCERAIRSSRQGLVCVSKNGYGAFDISQGRVVRSFGYDFEACTVYTSRNQPLRSAPGFVEMITQEELSPLLAHLPRFSDPEFDRKIKSDDVMWYDEASMVFVYQDSFGRPQGPEGLRANRVGYDVGSTASIPDIRLLTDYFKPGKFKFPFSISAGADYADNVYVLNFWIPPKDSGNVLPVTYWQDGSHWHWVFPVGTMIGEALFMQAPDDQQFYLFELRSRKRELAQWRTKIYRPYESAEDLATKIMALRPEWAQGELRQLIDHLKNPDSLIPKTLDTDTYSQIVEPFSGFLDYLPETSDYQLIKTLLKDTVYQDAMGKTFKQDSASRITYAPATSAEFHIIPKDYIGGLLATSEEACARCHDQGGRPLKDLDFRITLYGELWGEDRIFTWHPFDKGQDIYSVSDGSRAPNPRFVEAGLLVRGVPQTDSPIYRRLPQSWDPSYGVAQGAAY